jgi:methylenetetrahydrofolate reductase (NADPH)
MTLRDIFARQSRTLSFEFFPPKNERGWYTLEDTLDQLAPFGADFVSVTYGAGGSTRAKTKEIVLRLQDEHHLVAMAHLTCVNATRAEIAELLDDYHAGGIENIMALRGDPPKGEERFIPTEQGYTHATELLSGLQADGRFCCLGAAYPDGHVEATSRQTDWDHLIEKYLRGVAATVTQCFFALQPYLDMLHYVRQHIPDARIIPGVIPVTNYKGLVQFCQRCGAHLPDEFRAVMDPVANDPVASRRIGMQWTIDFCAKLLDAGAPGLHIYALNRSTAAAELVTSLRALGKL